MVIFYTFHLLKTRNRFAISISGFLLFRSGGRLRYLPGALTCDVRVMKCRGAMNHAEPAGAV